MTLTKEGQLDYTLLYIKNAVALLKKEGVRGLVDGSYWVSFSVVPEVLISSLESVTPPPEMHGQLYMGTLNEDGELIHIYQSTNPTIQP